MLFFGFIFGLELETIKNEAVRHIGLFCVAISISIWL